MSIGKMSRTAKSSKKNKIVTLPANGAKALMPNGQPIITKNRHFMDLWIPLTEEDRKARFEDICGDLQVLIENGNAAISELKEQIKQKQAEIKAVEAKQQGIMREAREKKILRSVMVEEQWDWNDKTITIMKLEDQSQVSRRHMNTEEASTLPLEIQEKPDLTKDKTYPI